VERGTGAVQVQVADLGWVKCRVSERRSYGCGRSPPLRMGGAHMMGVRAFANAGEAHRRLVLGQQEGGRGLPNIDAGAIDAERVAAPRPNRLESSEPAHRRLAECIRAANQSGIGETGMDQAASRRQHLCARGAGRGNGVDGTAKVEKSGDEIGEVASLLLS